jgi:uncharacterized protein (DUF1697 family)
MYYIALIRGINVGGNNKVDMKTLAEIFGLLGFNAVKTYINSGNVLFESDNPSTNKLVEIIQDKIKEVFGIQVKVLVLSTSKLEEICSSINLEWLNNEEMKTDVMFLPPEIDSPEVLKELKHDPEKENLIYVPGALVWNILRVNYDQGMVPKFIGSKLYTQITARNINTVRKLSALALNQIIHHG